VRDARVTEAPALRLMAVLAHPDDESLGLGGMIAKYAAEGVEVSLVTATRGESGRYLGRRDGREHPGPERLAAIREAELKAAAAVLGIRDLTLLNFRDGHLDEAEPREAVGRIVEHVRRVRPQVVVTFPPDGSYGHPDHIAICQLATAAMVAAADPAHGGPAGRPAPPPHAVSKLYYMVTAETEWFAYQAAFKTLTSTVDGIPLYCTTIVNSWLATIGRAGMITSSCGPSRVKPARNPLTRTDVTVSAKSRLSRVRSAVARARIVVVPVSSSVSGRYRSRTS